MAFYTVPEIGDNEGSLVPFNYGQTILAQYANSITIGTLIGYADLWLDEYANINNFYDFVWNVNTAQGFGLDIWGRIVGIGRTWPVPITTVYFDFEGTDGQGFDQEPFWSGNVATSNFTFADAAYRQLILAKAYSNITDATIPHINILLQTLFAGRGGNSYCLDNNNMSMTYYFGFPLSNVDLTVVLNTGILPRPGGIQIDVVHS